MKIFLNNRVEQLPLGPLSVEALLKEKNFTFRMMVVKINGILIRKEEYPIALIKEGDKVDVIHLISGG